LFNKDFNHGQAVRHSPSSVYQQGKAGAKTMQGASAMLSPERLNIVANYLASHGQKQRIASIIDIVLRATAIF
jgi:hypothetical protein